MHTSDDIGWDSELLSKFHWYAYYFLKGANLGRKKKSSVFIQQEGGRRRRRIELESTPYPTAMKSFAKLVRGLNLVRKSLVVLSCTTVEL